MANNNRGLTKVSANKHGKIEDNGEQGVPPIGGPTEQSEPDKEIKLHVMLAPLSLEQYKKDAAVVLEGKGVSQFTTILAHPFEIARLAEAYRSKAVVTDND